MKLLASKQDLSLDNQRPADPCGIKIEGQENGGKLPPFQGKLLDILSDMSEILISNIKIGRRIRKDPGDITKLADSIKEIGLLHPIVINEKNELIAGKRRIEAFKTLGRDKIPATKINLRDLLRGELDENTIRKNFTSSEVVAIRKEIQKTRIGHRPQKWSKTEVF